MFLRRSDALSILTVRKLYVVRANGKSTRPRQVKEGADRLSHRQSRPRELFPIEPQHFICNFILYMLLLVGRIPVSALSCIDIEKQDTLESNEPFEQQLWRALYIRFFSPCRSILTRQPRSATTTSTRAIALSLAILMSQGRHS